MLIFNWKSINLCFFPLKVWYRFYSKVHQTAVKPHWLHSWHSNPTFHSSKSVHPMTWSDSPNPPNVFKSVGSSMMHIVLSWAVFLLTMSKDCLTMVQSDHDTQTWHCKLCLCCWKNNRQKAANCWFCAQLAEGMSLVRVRLKMSTDTDIFCSMFFSDKFWKTWKWYQHSHQLCMFQTCRRHSMYWLCLSKVMSSVKVIWIRWQNEWVVTGQC